MSNTKKSVDWPWRKRLVLISLYQMILSGCGMAPIILKALPISFVPPHLLAATPCQLLMLKPGESILSM